MARRKDARFGLPAHVHVVKAKGREYYYYQEHRKTWAEGRRTRIEGTPFRADGLPDEEWWCAYRKLSGGEVGKPEAGSFKALIKAYRASPEWKALADKTRSEADRYLDRIEEIWGAHSARAVESHHVFALRDRFAETPAAANLMIRVLSALLTWGVPRGFLKVNPCLGVRGLMLKGGKPYEPWSWEAIELFRSVAAPEMWWAAALGLYTGQRQGDVLAMRWDDVARDLISVEQSKTGKRLWIPIHARLREVLEGVPRRSEFILTGERGGAWTEDGFRSVWGRQLNDERLAVLRRRRLVYHGLRKSAVVMLLEAGCTDAEVAAITGQTRDMVEHYAREVNQKRLAAAAILKWEQAGNGPAGEAGGC
ncbi:MAG: tyrosine-type recombinase/integrase [Candidatus Competibacter sp.]|nr:tyrosine-type recombinase/integrase [Candidatus Competibacter sp.]